MATPQMSIRGGHPDFLDLPWSDSITEWESERMLDLPTGIHRHEIVFVNYGEAIYAIKELPVRLARHEWEMLRGLESARAPTAEPIGLVIRPWIEPDQEHAGAVITRYVDFAFSYRELISGGGFGNRRNQMLDAFAGLLVELHLAGCFWGDCSLSNVLYRYDAATIDAVMIDAETSELHNQLTDGQRSEDLAIMVENVAGGMADIGMQMGIDVDQADLALGEDIVLRYQALWDELAHDLVIAADERYRIAERIGRLNHLGFEVEDVELVPEEGGQRLRFIAKVKGRTFHTDRLRELTQIHASENQARQILSDLDYYARRELVSGSGKTVAAIRWRVGVFEPMLARIKETIAPEYEPIQAFTDFLHHRYIMSVDAGQDVGNDAAFDNWIEAGQPGYPVE